MGRDHPNDQVFDSGTVGTWNVLDASEKECVNWVVSYSSVNAMGLFMGESEPDYLSFAEEHGCRPGRPYGTSKYVGEQMCRLFMERTEISTVCIRPPAVLSDERIASMRRAHAEQPESAWTPFWEYGCYIHVEDLARATVCALTCPDPGHEVLLVVAEDISSRAMSSKEWAETWFHTFPGAAGLNMMSIPIVHWSTAGALSACWAGNLSTGGTVRPSARLRPALA